MIFEIIPEIKTRPLWIWITGTLFLFAVLMILTLKFTMKNTDPLTAAERAWLKAHPVIRFAPDPDFPPVEYFDKDGVYSGITADYVALIEKKLGIRIKIVRLRNWNELIANAKSRQIDMFAATKTPQRAEYLLFTRPYLELPAAIIAREKVKEPLTVEKLYGMKVSVVSEYAVHNFITFNYPKLNLDVVPDVQTGLRKVSFGMSDAFVENLATATYYIEKEGITNLRIAGESGYVYSMGFCSRKDWPELNRILEKGLVQINAEERQAIYKKWIPLEPRSLFASKEFQAGVIAAFAAALLIVAGVIAWNRSLAKQVSRRTEELEKELSERKRMEEELQHARDKLEKRVEERTAELAKTVNKLLLSQFCIDKAAIGIYQSTFERDILNANEFACQSLGYTADELRALKISDIDPLVTHEKMLEIKRMLDSTGSATFETVLRRKDGTTFPAEIATTQLEFQGKSYVYSFVKDITERKRAEEEITRRQRELEELNESLENRVREEVEKNREKDVILIQQNRQAALGEMMDHIAHQWKQPLNSISFIIQDLGETWASGELKGENVEEAVGNIMALLTHMAQTIDVFRNFYRPEKERSVFRLQDSIDSALTFMTPALRFHGVRVEVDADPELSAIGYPNEYAQVLLNIFTNARDTFKERKVDKPVLRIEAFAESNKAVVAITDNAGGIPETIIDKIFDLYFTTRESKDGTGIGLYMSRNIIEKNMGGTVTAANVDGGARFRIELNVPEM